MVDFSDKNVREHFIYRAEAIVSETKILCKLLQTDTPDAALVGALFESIYIIAKIAAQEINEDNQPTE